MKYQDYEHFVNYRMRISHVYQPVMLMTLLQNDGKASTTEIAKSDSQL
jgi:ATP adenylyltransferase